MVIVKKNDFIELDFVARISDTKQIFDLTKEDLAKKEHLYNPRMKYCPKIICVGQGHILPAVDKHLEGKEIGTTFTVHLRSEESFGKKDNTLLKTVPTSTLTKQNIRPYPGLQISAAGGLVGTVRSVTAGRTMVDFNHPLAGKDVEYEVTIHRVVEDAKEKMDSLVLAELGFLAKDYSCDIQEKNISLQFAQKLPEGIQKIFLERAQSLLSGFSITFV